MTRRLLALLLLGVLVLVSACSGQEDQGDKELEVFEGKGFSIKLPGKPESTTQTVPTPAGDIELTTYVVESDDAAIAVGVVELPEGTPGDLDGAVTGAATNIGGQVEESETAEYDGYESRDCRITARNESGDVTVFCRMVLAGSRLVQIQQVVKGKDLQQPPANYDEMVGSLTIG